MNKKNNSIIKYLKNSLIASCQPIPKGPLDSSSFILASAKASIIGGAKALRIEGFKNLKSKSDDLMKKIARAKDDKESYEDMVGLSLESSDDLRKKVSNYIRIEIDSLGAQATLALLNLDGKKKDKYKQLDKLLSRRENVRTLQKLYDDLQE